jgi:superfamily II DNA/RNA helicase
MDLMEQNVLRLDGIDTVVLDEADRMADMGFLPEVRKILDQCPDDRRTILFSATLDGEVDVLVKHYQHDPVRHEVETPEHEQGEVDHHFWSVTRNDRVATAASIVDRMGPTVVFCRTKRGADRVAEQLARAGVDAVAIHGDRSQAQRDRALAQFKQGRAAALVATDVAARGIHVDDVAAVIHFDPPEDPKDYVHRSGRTGRAGRRGVVVSFVPQEKRKLVSRMQRDLDLPSGLDLIDLTALGEPNEYQRPVRPSNRVSRSEARRERSGGTEHKPERTERTERTERSERTDRPAFGRRRFERNARNDNTGGRGGKGNGRSRRADGGSGNRDEQRSGGRRDERTENRHRTRRDEGSTTKRDGDRSSRTRTDGRSSGRSFERTGSRNDQPGAPSSARRSGAQHSKAGGRNQQRSQGGARGRR